MSEPRRFGDAAGAYVSKSLSREATSSAAVLRAWAEIIGPEIGRRTTGGSFRKGELVVYAESSAWANELQLMSEMLRERLNERLGKETVGALRFTVSNRVEKANRKRSSEEALERVYEPVGALADLSPEDSLRVDETVSGVPDEDVRDALRRAMETSLRIRAKRGRNRR